MFEDKSLLEIFRMGGFVMYILIFCSVISIAVILERILYYYSKSQLKREPFMRKLRKEIEAGNMAGAIELAKKVKSPVSDVAYRGLKIHDHHSEEISNTMEREITIETIKLEKYTSIVGTIGNIAVYIGLFGTVIGIVRAFHNISATQSSGMSTVIGGVAEALICTATGLLVAIPAVIAFNYFSKRIDGFVNEMELCASELLDMLNKGK